MNKSYIVVLAVVGLILIAGIGYAVWNNFNNPQVVLNTQPQRQLQH